MWVKICGNTSLGDALAAAQQGADAVGFVFAESKRRVTVAQVAAITPHLPAGVERVGVFYSRDASEIQTVVGEAGLTTVQLHGGLNEKLLGRLAGGVKIIQTLHWVVGDEASAEQLRGELGRVAAGGVVDRVLIDSKVGTMGGGTGVAFDWAGAREVLRAAPSGLRLIVAGGLKPENVAEAIAQLQPWGVDVVSGVEAAPGRKDLDRLARFLKNARGAETP
jgi:phosphoribosylanthranilate isomerase